MKEIILFYSSVKDIEYFKTQRFYRIDIELLEQLGYSVIVTNKLSSFLTFKYDIAFLYFYRFGALAAIIARLLGKKVYFTGGIDDLNKDTTSQRAYNIQVCLFKLCYLFANRCIIVSTSDLNNIKNIYRPNRWLRKLTISFHTIDIEKYKALSISKKSVSFLTIGWMMTKGNVIRKGMDKAIRLFAFIKQNEGFENATMTIIGMEGEGAVYLKSIVDELNIQDEVRFLGAISEEEKLYILAKSKYYFQLSKYEGFGLAALESLASGNIVIHSGRGGLADCIRNYGICINQDTSNEEALDLIRNFDNINIPDGRAYVRANFANTRRYEDFKKIMG